MKLLALLLPLTLTATVSIIHVPNGGIQPQVVERDGVVHMIYFAGDAQKGDLSIAVGNIRGAQLAVGRNGRVHVAWNGTESTEQLGGSLTAFDKPTGACGRCGTKAFAEGTGIHVLFRSTDNGKTKQGETLNDGQPEKETGTAPAFPVWGLVAAFAKPDGTFILV